MRIVTALILKKLMKNELSVSVVVTTYKRLDRLVNCIAAVQGQTMPVQEIIVIHDGPDDDFDRFMQQKYRDQIESGNIKALTTPSWEGRPAPGRNLGLRLAQSHYISFCDDDDIWMPQKVEAQLKYMVDNNAVDALFSEYIPYFEGGHIRLGGAEAQPASMPIRSEAVSLTGLLSGRGLCLSSSFIRRQALTGFNFKELAYVKAFEDYALWLDLVIKGRVVVELRVPLLYYLMNNKLSIRKGRVVHNLRLSSYIFGALIFNLKIGYAFIFPFLRLAYLSVKLLSVR